MKTQFFHHIMPNMFQILGILSHEHATCRSWCEVLNMHICECISLEIPCTQAMTHIKNDFFFFYCFIHYFTPIGYNKNRLFCLSLLKNNFNTHSYVPILPSINSLQPNTTIWWWCLIPTKTKKKFLYALVRYVVLNATYF